MRLSSKPTVYFIDGLNMVRRYLNNPDPRENNHIDVFLDWLSQCAGADAFAVSDFRVIFDGVYRGVGPLVRNNVTVHFSDERTADEMIHEQAVYYQETGRRCCVVTSDRRLAEGVRAEGVKTIGCDGFIDLLERGG